MTREFHNFIKFVSVRQNKLKLTQPGKNVIFTTAFDTIALKYCAYVVELLSHKMTIFKWTKQIDCKCVPSVKVEYF